MACSASPQSRDRSFWLQVSTLAPGPAYRGNTFYERFKSSGPGSLFDPALFTQRLADGMLSGFLSKWLSLWGP